MNHTMFVLLIVGLAAAGLIVYGFFGKSKSDYKTKQLMSDNEREFFRRLVLALPNHFVFPQVGMSSILDANIDEKNKRKHASVRNTFSQKVVDYVICDQSLDVVAIVELDDKTHDPKKDKRRDEMLKQGGYKKECLIRFESKQKPTVEEISKRVAAVMATRIIAKTEG